MTEYHPNYVACPGATLEQLLSNRTMSVWTLAEQTGINVSIIVGVFEGTEPITSGMAEAFGRVFDVPAAFWNTRESRYREYLRDMRVD